MFSWKLFWPFISSSFAPVILPLVFNPNTHFQRCRWSFMYQNVHHGSVYNIVSKICRHWNLLIMTHFKIDIIQPLQLWRRFFNNICSTLYFPKMAIKISAILQVLLQCDLEASLWGVETISPLPGMSLGPDPQNHEQNKIIVLNHQVFI